MRLNVQKLLTTIPITIFLSLIGCGTDTLVSNQEQADFREIAWNHISQEEKEQVVGDWRDARVQIAEFSGENAVWVTFDSDSFLGPIIVIIDLKTKAVISTLPRF